jgi:hypothetical protein
MQNSRWQNSFLHDPASAQQGLLALQSGFLIFVAVNMIEIGMMIPTSYGYHFRVREIGVPICEEASASARCGGSRDIAE